MRVEIFNMAKLFLLPDAPDNPPLEIIETMLLIGRKPDNTLQVEDANVSKYHALLVKTEEGYRLFDLHSANGTYVNEHRVTVALIKHNDQIRVGPATFRFELETTPAATAAPQPPAQPKVRFHGGLGAKPLGRKPASPAAATVIEKPAPPVAPTPVAAPAPTPVATSSLVPESSTPPPAPVVTAQPSQELAVPVAEVSSQALPPVIVQPPASEPRSFIRIPQGKKADLDTPTPPTPVAVKVTPAPEAPAAPPAPAAEPPAAPAPKPAVGERTLRPKLGGLGGGGGEMKLKTLKK